MKAIGRLLGWIWAALFLAFAAATFYENSGNELPEEIAAYRDMFQGWLESFLGSGLFFLVFVVGWFAVSYQLGKQSGWRTLAEDYAESGSEQPLKFSTVSGYVGSVPFQGSLRVSAHSLGLALRVFVLFRFGSPNLNIPWTAVDSIIVRNRASPPGKSNFLERLSARMSEARYAHIRLIKHRDQVLIIPWSGEFRAGVPSNVKLIVEDD